MKKFIVQVKGGSGKSYLTKLLSLKAEKERTETFFLDCDNASASTTKFFKSIEERKSSYIKYASFNLLGTDKKIDRTKFDNFLSEIEKLENVVVDFGAASSEQLLFYIQEETKNNVLDTFKEMGIEIYLVIAGGGSAKECMDFFEQANKIDGMGAITSLVANEFFGGVNGRTVKDYTNSKIQINKLHEDSNSDAQNEWDKLMTNGVVYADILAMNVIRKRRIVNYLDNIFDQIGQA